MRQPFAPATYMDDPLYFMRATLFVMLLCMGYSLSRPINSAKAEENILLPSTTGNDLEGEEKTSLQSWQKAVSEKAVERYAATQGKKWRRWNEVMFERSS